MSKKQGSRRRQAPKQEPAQRVPVDRRALEKTLWDIGKVMRERDFESIDEANAFLQQYTGQKEIPAPPPETPLEKAQEVMYAAFDARGRRRVQLAHEALAISEDCADAYVLLAEEEAKSPEKAYDLYTHGVAAGERALGPEIFQECVGQFWGLLETRPYMRARAGLARTLWYMDQTAEAVVHYREMLRLNPGDNQGLRYELADCLLELGRDSELGDLLGQYKDEATATWAYTRALWLFRTKGGNPAATTALDEALSVNSFVVLYLLGIKELPRRLPDRIGYGDESEAVDYVATYGAYWFETPGAMEWFVTVLSDRMDRDDALED